MSMAEREYLLFDRIKEARTGYFVEYCPPMPTADFAQLQLTFPSPTDLNTVVSVVENESRGWLDRFPGIPIMASAFDEKEDLIDLRPIRPDRFFYTWTDPAGGMTKVSWDIDEFSRFTNSNALTLNLREVFYAVPVRTKDDVRREADEYTVAKRRQNLFLKFVFFVWLAVLPATWALIEFFGSEWLGGVVLAYGLWKAYRAGQKALGCYKPSKAEHEKEAKDAKMAHYYYHCERNPAGFRRLRNENMDEDAKSRVLRDARNAGLKF